MKEDAVWKERNHDVVKKVYKEKRAVSAVQVAGRKPEEPSTSPQLKATKFEKYVDEVRRRADGTEHLLSVPEGVVREVFSGNDRPTS